MTRQRKRLIAAGAIALVVVAGSVFDGVSDSILLFISLVVAMTSMLVRHGGRGGHVKCVWGRSWPTTNTRTPLRSGRTRTAPPPATAPKPAKT